MKSKAFFGSLMGSALVYVAMAACVATENIPHESTGKVTTGVGGSGGMGNGGFGGFVDAMVDPVPDANAETSGSGTRLKARYHVGSDGSRIQAEQWYDTTLGHTCSALPMKDGTRRCVPLGIGTYHFADAACEQPFGVITNKNCAPEAKYAQSFEPEACNLHYKIYSVKAPIEPAQVFAVVGGTCQAATKTPDWQYFELGNELPPSDFVQFDTVTDP